MNLAIREYLGKSSLFKLDLIDLPDAVEARMHEHYQNLVHPHLQESQPERIQSILLARSSQGTNAYRNVQEALLYAILSKNNSGGVETDQGDRYFHWLLSLVTDEWAVLAGLCRYFSFTRYAQLQSSVRVNLFKLVQRLASLHAKGVDGLIVGLLRQVSGLLDPESADWTRLAILETLVGEGHEAGQPYWVSGQPSLIPFALLSMLRWIAEEATVSSSTSSRSPIYKMSVKISQRLLRERPKECFHLGRELVRLLWTVSRLPEFKAFWQELLRTSPGSTENTISRLLQMPTPKRYMPSRLTPQLEGDLLYLCEHVRVGSEGRYLEWLDQRHSLGPVLIADVIRFLVTSYHPAHGIVTAPVVQRWSLIESLLGRIGDDTLEAYLALFMDLICFEMTGQSNNDSLMCIEPAVLLLIKTLSSSLLDFLEVGVTRDFLPQLESSLVPALDQGMQVAIQRGVLHMDSIQKIDPTTKERLERLFPSISVKRNHSKAISSEPTPQHDSSLHKAQKPINEILRLQLLLEKTEILLLLVTKHQQACTISQEGITYLLDRCNELKKVSPEDEERVRFVFETISKFPSGLSWKEAALVKGYIQTEDASSISQIKASLIAGTDLPNLVCTKFVQIAAASMQWDLPHQLLLWYYFDQQIRKEEEGNLQLLYSLVQGLSGVDSTCSNVFTDGLVKLWLRTIQVADHSDGDLLDNLQSILSGLKEHKPLLHQQIVQAVGSWSVEASKRILNL